MIIEEAIKQYLSFLSSQRRLSQPTLSAYSQSLADFAAFLAEQSVTSTDQLTPSHPRLWQAQLMQQGMAPRSVLRHLSALRGWCKFIRSKQWTSLDLLCKITPPKCPKNLPVFFRQNEVEQIYNQAVFDTDFNGIRDALLLRILYETGMRRAEVVSLKIEAVDFSGRVIKVRGKRNKDRLIPVQQELLNNIQRYLSVRSSIPAIDTTLFITDKGQRLSFYRVSQIVKRYMSVLAPHATKVSPHVFRHTFATQMLNQGADIFAIKELLGHSSLNATEIYTHVFSEHLQSTYNHAHPRAINKKED